MWQDKQASKQETLKLFDIMTTAAQRAAVVETKFLSFGEIWTEILAKS